MKNTGKKVIGAGVATLLVTTVAALNASAAPVTSYQSYAEAQVVYGNGGLDGAIVDPLADAAVESPSTNSCEPPTEDCAAVESTESPLGDALLPLTTALGDALGGVNGTGLVGNYSTTGGGASYAASGALTNEGAIDLGSEADPSDPVARFALSSGALEPLAAVLADVRLEIGAASAAARLATPTDVPVWSPGNTVTPTGPSGLDYNIADASIVLQVPALADLNTALGGAVNTAFADPLKINLETLCQVQPTVLGTIDILGVPTEVNLCDNLAVAAPLFEAEITGLSDLFDGLTTLTQDGVTFNFQTGEVTIDLAAAVEAVTGTSINELPPNTDLLATVLPALALNLDELIASVYDDVVANILALQIDMTLATDPLPSIELSTLGEGALPTLLGTVFDGLEQGLLALGDPLAGALDQITAGLTPLLQLRVNVPNAYAAAVADRLPKIDGTAYSETALRIIVADGALADLFLGNALVGPNAAITIDDQTQAQTQSPQTEAQTQSPQAQAQPRAQAQGGFVDSPVDTLPSTGASNLWPFWLLGLLLVALGTAALINEKRRQTALV